MLDDDIVGWRRRSLAGDGERPASGAQGGEKPAAAARGSVGRTPAGLWIDPNARCAHHRSHHALPAPRAQSRDDSFVGGPPERHSAISCTAARSAVYLRAYALIL